MMPRERFRGNRASSAEWEMDSNPTKAQGARVKMVKTPPAALCPVEKAGENDAPVLPAASVKQIRTPPNSAAAITIWVRSAHLRRRHSSAAISSEPTASRISPKYTW